MRFLCPTKVQYLSATHADSLRKKLQLCLRNWPCSPTASQSSGKASSMAVPQLRVAVPVEFSTSLGFFDVLRETWGRMLNTKYDCRFEQRRRKKKAWSLFSLLTNTNYSCAGLGPEKDLKLSLYSSLVVNPAGDVSISSEQKVLDVVLKQAALMEKQLRKKKVIEVKKDTVVPGTNYLLNEAYDRCREVCAEYAKTFYLGTLLMTPERRRAIWAIYVWCRRTDELVDGPNASHITPSALDRWQARLEGVFAGRPYDMFDAALSDTVMAFPVDIQPFKDMIEGMRMDLKKSRYKNFDELYLYCYYVAGTVGLMSVPVMGIAPESLATTESVYNAALALGIANQLTNILRDVGEDARRGRVYLPQDELAMAGLSDEDIFSGKEAEKGVAELNQASKWPVLASLLLYRQILDEIEANDYDCFTKRAYVSKAKKLMALPLAYGRTLINHPPRRKTELVKP